jgi:hypothetical protein
MKTKLNALVGLLGVVGLAVLGCSGSPLARCGEACSNGAGQAGHGADDRDPASAGTGGAAQVGDGDDDGGARPTTGGAGGADDDANEAGAPATTEPSQWVVYLADEDTPGKNELYAIRVADLGQPKRIKISPELGEHPLIPIAESSIWSPDGGAYAFRSSHGDGDDFYIVRFREDGVEPAALVAPNLPPGSLYSLEWSPSGNAVLLGTKEGVVVAEPDAQGAYLGKKLGYLGTETAVWKDDHTIIHSVYDEVANNGMIFISTREQDDWVTTPLVRDVAVSSLSLSADRRTIAYSVGLPGQHDIFACAAVLGCTPRLVAGSGMHELYWFPVRANFLVVDQGKLAWGTSAETSSAQPINEPEVVPWDFTPDGSRLEFWQEESGRFARLGLYDFEQGKSTMHDLLRNLDASPGGLAWTRDGSSYLGVHQPDALADVDLVLGDPTNPANSKTIDTIPSSDRFSFLHFSDSGEFLVYDREHGDSWETLYVDLRGVSATQRPRIKVPGEGLTWSFDFEPGGSNATYTMRREDGAQPCFFLDLSRQVAKPPAQVSGEGRVQYCVLQPRAK